MGKDTNSSSGRFFTEIRCIAFAALVVTVLYNEAAFIFLFSQEKLNSLHSVTFRISIFILIYEIVLLGFLIFYASNTTKIGLFILYLISSSMSYFSRNFGVIFDENVIKSTFETTLVESSQYLNKNLLFWLTLNILTATAFIVLVKYKRDSLRNRLKNLTYVLIFIIISTASIGSVFYKDYASFLRNNRHFRHMINPTSPIYESVKYARKTLFPKNFTFTEIGTDAKYVTETKNKKTIVFILGETARSDHFSLNGYSLNNTTPQLNNLDVVSFPNMTSCGTSTAVSVPCLFSNLGRQNFSLEISNQRSNLLDIIQTSGYEVLWIDNNTGCQGICDRVKNVDIQKFRNDSICSAGTCYDEILIKALESVLDPQKNQFIVLHTLGSHGPSYYKRYPKSFLKFQPSCETSELSNCTKEQVINTYDNTILYTDYIISEVIRRISSKSKTNEKMLIYLSDHGESLGENGLYLHSLPYFIAPKEQKHVPLILWTENFNHKSKPIDKTPLRKIKDCLITHDNIFSTTLNLLEIFTSTYSKKTDLMSLTKKDCNEHIK